MYSFLTFVAWKCTKCTQKSYNWSFWPIFGHLNPQNGRLYHKRSTFRGSYSVKSFNKFALQENVSNSVFFLSESALKVSKRVVRGQNLQTSTPKWTIKISKNALNIAILVKTCVLFIFHGKSNITFLINLFFNLNCFYNLL